MALQNPTESIGTFLKAFVGQRPVYSLGKQIGYWTGGNPAELCAGKIMLYKGAALGDPKIWTTRDDLWREVPVPSFCLSKGIKPGSLTTEETAAIVQKPTGELVIPGKYNDEPLSDSNKVIVASAAIAAGTLILTLLLSRR